MRDPNENPLGTHALEQLEAFTRDFAPVVRRYHVALIDAGFTPAEAFTLTVEWQASMIAGTMSRRST